MSKKSKKEKKSVKNQKNEEISISGYDLIMLNRLKRIDPESAIFVQRQWYEKQMLYAQLKEALESEAKAWEENRWLKLEISKLRKEIEIKNTEIVRMKSELETKSSRIATLEAQVRTLTERIGVAEQIYATLLQQIILLKRKVAELATEDIKEIIQKYMSDLENMIRRVEQEIKYQSSPIVIPEKGGEGGK